MRSSTPCALQSNPTPRWRTLLIRHKYRPLLIKVVQDDTVLDISRAGPNSKRWFMTSSLQALVYDILPSSKIYDILPPTIATP